MSNVKCIYCGRDKSDGIEISISDIIPDALTNSKITCKNVCKIDHNNRFSDMFESKIINELSFIRNYLNIKNKSNKYPEYPIKLKIVGQIYDTKTNTLDNSKLVGNKVISSEDKLHKLGPKNIMRKMKSKDKEAYKEIDLSKQKIEKMILLNTDIFNSSEMLRLVSKIAYEWFCKVNNINEKYKDFDNIIKFITTGDMDKNVVSIITDERLYDLLNNSCFKGSHFLYCYYTQKEGINVIVSLFGLLSYKVKLCNYSEKFKKVNFSEEFMVNGERNFNEFFGGTVELLEFKDIVNIGLNGLVLLLKENPQENFKNILIKNYDELLIDKAIHIKTLKRFVKEYNLATNLELNQNNSDVNFWFKLNIIAQVGLLDKENSTKIELRNILIKLFEVNNNNRNITGKSKLFRDFLLKISNYKECIKKGAQIINNLN